MPALPARVRLSRLTEPPGQGVLAQLRRLSPHAPLARLAELPSPALACFVALAGGKIVGFLLAEGVPGENGAGAWRETLALEASWRGRGIEDALRGERVRLKAP